MNVCVCGSLVWSDFNLRHRVSSLLTHWAQPHSRSHYAALRWDQTHSNTCRRSTNLYKRTSTVVSVLARMHRRTNINTKTSSVCLKNLQVYITSLIAAEYTKQSNYGNTSVRVWICSQQRVIKLLPLSCGAASTFNKISFHRNEMCVCFLRVHKKKTFS